MEEGQDDDADEGKEEAEEEGEVEEEEDEEVEEVDEEEGCKCAISVSDVEGERSLGLSSSCVLLMYLVLTVLSSDFLRMATR